jgi:hypothetical protein
LISGVCMAAVYICEDFSFPCVFGTLSFSLLEPPTSARPLSFSPFVLHTTYAHTQPQVANTSLPRRKPHAEGRGGAWSSGWRDLLLRLPAQEDDKGGRGLGRGGQALEAEREAHGVIVLGVGGEEERWGVEV